MRCTAIRRRLTAVLVAVGVALGGVNGSPACAAEASQDVAGSLTRADAVWLMTWAGPNLSRAAQAALLGSSAEWDEFVATGAQQAFQGDTRVRLAQVMDAGGDRLRVAGAQALAGSTADVEQFLASGFGPPLAQDLRIQAARIADGGGETVRQQAAAALAGTDADVLRFLAQDRFVAADADDRLQVARILDADPGPAVRQAASAAMGAAAAGSMPEVREFLDSGWELAQVRDAELVSLEQLAQTAQAAGLRAVQEKDAATVASGRAVQAAHSAEEAAVTAQQETLAAKESADKTAAAAGRAADAAAQAADAAQSAIDAANAASQAAREASDAAAKASQAAVLAAQAAARAYGAAQDAGRDASKAQAARQAAATANQASKMAVISASAAWQAAEAIKAVKVALSAALGAASNAQAAAQAADEAGEHAAASRAQADRAQRAAAVARRRAAVALDQARRAQTFAEQAETAARQAHDHAKATAAHAQAAAQAAQDAADHAGDSVRAAANAQAHASAAKAAAQVATDAVTTAEQIHAQARVAEQQRLRDVLAQGTLTAQLAKEQQDRARALDQQGRTVQERRDQETLALLAQARAVDASDEVVWSVGRQAAMRLFTDGDPWLQTAAAHALAGGVEDLRVFVDTGVDEAIVMDERNVIDVIVAASSIDAERTAAQEASQAGPQAVREFLATGAYPGRDAQDMLDLARLAGSGGSTMRNAVVPLLDTVNVTPAQRREFLDTRLATVAEQDVRAETAKIAEAATMEAEPELHVAAVIASMGPASYAQEFLATEQYRARHRDALAAAHIQRVQACMAQIHQAAALAQQAAAQAAQVAVTAKQAADAAAQASAQAQQYATQAQEYNAQAQEYNAQAQESAARAQKSADQATAAAEQARKDAETATQAEGWAVVAVARAYDSANAANTSANQARASAIQAGQDLKTAAEQAEQALRAAIQKALHEQRALEEYKITLWENANRAAAQAAANADLQALQAEAADWQTPVLDIVTTNLDILGLVDQTPLSDGASAIISALRGDRVGAGASLIAIIPIFGSFSNMGRAIRGASDIVTDTAGGGARTVFRADTRGPEEIFSQGFQPKGNNLNLVQHVNQNPADSGFISTTHHLGSAQDFADEVGAEWIYKARASGIDVNAHLGSASPFPWENEIAVPGPVSASSIEGAWGPGGWVPNLGWES